MVCQCQAGQAFDTGVPLCHAFYTPTQNKAGCTTGLGRLAWRQRCVQIGYESGSTGATSNGTAVGVVGTNLLGQINWAPKHVACPV